MVMVCLRLNPNFGRAMIGGKLASELACRRSDDGRRLQSADRSLNDTIVQSTIDVAAGLMTLSFLVRRTR